MTATGVRPPTAVATAPTRHRRPVSPSQRLLTVGLCLYAVYSVAPVWWLLVNATKDRRDLYSTNGLWFAGWSLDDNLRQLITYQDGIFFRWLGNTLLYAGGGAAMCTVVSLAAGYSLSKFRYRGRELGLGVVIGSFLIPSTLITVPLFLVFSRIGLVDTVWSVLVPLTVSPFGVYLAKVYVDASVPDELLEAARLDGAGEWRIFTGIVARLMPSGAATIFVLLFVGNWNNFFLPLTMLRGSRRWTLALGLYDWFVHKNDSIADRTALTLVGALLSVIPLAVTMIAMQRYWRSGVTTGAVK